MTAYMRKWTKWMLCLAALTLVAGTVLPAMAADAPKTDPSGAATGGIALIAARSARINSSFLARARSPPSARATACSRSRGRGSPSIQARRSASSGSLGELGRSLAMCRCDVLIRC